MPTPDQCISRFHCLNLYLQEFLAFILQDLRKANSLKSQVDTYKKQVREQKVSALLLLTRNQFQILLILLVPLK